MSNVRIILVLSSVAVSLAACSKPSGGGAGDTGSASVTSAAAPKGGSCNLEKSGVCHEYADSALGLVEGACTGMLKGTYAKAACSTQNLLGTCELKDEKKLYYFGNSDAPWVSDAKEDCEKNAISPGKFTPAPGAEETAKAKALPAADRIAGSCVKEDGSCEDHFGDMLDLSKSTCEQFGGKYSTTACPTDKLVASCLKHGKVERIYEKDLKERKMSELEDDCVKLAIPFGHFYPDPNAKVAAPAAKAAGGAKAKKK